MRHRLIILLSLVPTTSPAATLKDCILIAVASQGNKTVKTETMRLDATGGAFKVYRCGQEPTTALPQPVKYNVDTSRPLRRFDIHGGL